MALRISGSAAVPAAPSAPALGDRAALALAAGDVDGFSALWARASEVEGRHGPYTARVTLAEQALAATQGLPPAKLPRIYAAAAAATLAALEEEPREPRLLNLAAVFLYELWALEPAERLFRAALRLDPELPHVERNLDEVHRRRRDPRGAVGLPAVVQVGLPALATRARAVAARAQPVEGLTLTLAMIVRDEEEMLPRCLAAAAPAVDEIVVVDTGSTDRTVEIAAATSDWIMYLDADEVLVEADRDALRALTGQTWREAFYLVETNFTGELEDGTAVVNNALRVFRNRPEYRFDGRLHEQIADKLPGHLPERLSRTPVRVEHFGYLSRVRQEKDKGERNIAILRRQIAEAPEVTAFMHFNLGSELAAAGDGPGAVAEFDRAWEMVLADERLVRHGFTPALATRYVKALRVLGRLDDAERAAHEALAFFPGFTDLVLDLGHVAALRGDDEEALRRFAECVEMGEAPNRYTSVMGSGGFLPLQAAAALRQRRGELAEARALLERALAEHPRYLGTVDPLAQVLLAQGVGADEVVERVLGGVAEPTAGVHFMLGTALFEAGAVEAAAARFAEVLERRPHSSAARVALAEAQLSLGDLDRAAQTAALVPAGDPLAAAAARTAAFARLAGGDADAELALLESADRAVYGGWAAALRGEAPVALALDAAEPLLTALEALLHLQAFEAFEVLVPLVAALPLSQRDRHERLAAMYLRRGYLESAADEWIAACELGGPDTAALCGLARVAAARGLPEDARVFAGEAHELDPHAREPAALLAALA